MRTNLTGGFLMARECYTQWMREHGGAIVNIVADMWQGMPTMGHSGAARAGMVNFTETAAGEWAAAGVRVNAVAPGWIASSGMDHYPPEMGARIRSMKDTCARSGAWAPKARCRRPSCFCCRRPRASFPAPPCASTARCPTHKIGYPLPPNPNPAPAYDGFHRAVRPKVLGEE